MFIAVEIGRDRPAIVGPNGAASSTAMKAVFRHAWIVRQGPMVRPGSAEDITALHRRNRVWLRGWALCANLENILYLDDRRRKTSRWGAFIRRE